MKAQVGSWRGAEWVFPPLAPTSPPGSPFPAATLRDLNLGPSGEVMPSLPPAPQAVEASGGGTAWSAQWPAGSAQSGRGDGCCTHTLGARRAARVCRGRGWNAVENPRESRLVTVGGRGGSAGRWRVAMLPASGRQTHRAPKGGGKGLFISGPRVTQARDFLLWFSPQRNLLPQLLGSPTFQPHPGAGPAPSRCPF